MAKTNYSLLTLLIACATIAAGVSVWFRSSPWERVGVYPRAEFDRFIQGKPWDDPSRTPDGTRKLVNRTQGYYCYLTILDNDGSVLFEFPKGTTANGFIDDNTILNIGGPWRDDLIDPADEFEVYHRLYPEWWWGHFFRPEVWLALIFGSLSAWRVIVWFWARREVSHSRAQESP